jgi:hypothetical protein
MSNQPNPSIPSTTESVRAATASRVGGDPAAGRRGRRKARCPGEGEKFTLGAGVERGAGSRPYERQPGDPLYRPLYIYTVDAGTRQDEGAMAVVNVPYEPLEKGPRGHVFHVMPVLTHPAVEDAADTCDIDLNDPFLLLTDGRTPSPVDPRFHQQMVYAVASLVYASFRRALGRHVAWGFDPHEGDDDGTRLRLTPHGRRGHAGATYDRESGEVRFGFVKTENGVRGRAAPNGHTFSCVSHDIVTHEVTHALLDGLRAYFLEPTSADVLGFHEGFADVIALLHHFSYTEVVRAAVRRSRGKVLQSALLTSIATEFGLATGNGEALRSLNNVRATDGAPGAPHEENTIPVYREGMDPHEMGKVFASAVFYAFTTVYTHKAERYLRLASGGTGMLPPGDISNDLQDVLVEEVSQLASQFLNVCIRAIDYCPPVDLQLGEFLRAVITADLDLVPDDQWEYREAWIDAFALHRIFPRGVQSMSEDQLKWDPVPFDQSLTIKELSFTELEFDGDPACAPSAYELRRRACALGKFVADHPDRFGMVPSGHPHLNGDEVTLPEVQSVRSSRRVGPDGQVVFDLVAEVTQTRKVVQDDIKFLFRGGCTIIIGPKGEVRYVIGKDVAQNSRVFRQKKFMLGPGSEHVTTLDDIWKVSDAETVQFSHQHG